MKREVWVEMPESEMSLATCHLRAHGRVIPMRHETLHESRWIPVSETPEREGRYPIVLENQDKFNGYSGYWDGDSWTHPVKLWLEAPDLPEDKSECSNEGFEKWYEFTREVIRREKMTSKEYYKFLYESARREEINPLPVEDEFERWYKEKFPVIATHFEGSNHYEND